MQAIENQTLEDDDSQWERRSPVDNRVTWKGRWATQQQVHQAVLRAHACFAHWSQTSLEQRIQHAQQYASFLQSHRDSIAQTIALETGKPLWESDLEVVSAMAKVEHAIDAIRMRRWTTVVGTGTSYSTTRFKPLGVMVVLGPFNLPLHLPGAHIVPALLAGNTILFKPSEKAPAVGDWINRAWKAAELPEGVLELAHGAVEQSKWAVDATQTAGVLFTGSYAAGRQIHRQLAGRPDCLLALEMGGNNPLVVDRIKNRQAAIAVIIQSAYITSGQRCTCARRLIVVDCDENKGFLEELSSSISKIQVGNPLSQIQPFMGTLVSSHAAEGTVAAQCELLAGGAKILNEAIVDSSCSAQISPGLVFLPKPFETDQEVFGPLLTATVATDLDDAIQYANRTQYGLAAGILTEDRSAYQHFVNHVRAGIVNWNSPTTGASGKLPFGGTGASGNHRPSGYYAADYCSYPVASIEMHELPTPTSLPPGLQGIF